MIKFTRKSFLSLYRDGLPVVASGRSSNRHTTVVEASEHASEHANEVKSNGDYEIRVGDEVYYMVKIHNVTYDPNYEQSVPNPQAELALSASSYSGDENTNIQFTINRTQFTGERMSVDWAITNANVVPSSGVAVFEIGDSDKAISVAAGEVGPTEIGQLTISNAQNLSGGQAPAIVTPNNATFTIIDSSPGFEFNWLKGIGNITLPTSANYPNGEFDWVENDYLNQNLDIYRVWTVAARVATWAEMGNGGSGANWPLSLNASLIPTRVIINHAFPPIPLSHRTNFGANQNIYARIASGEFDQYYTGAAQTFRSQLIANGRDGNGGSLILTLGHEQSGNWYPWSVFDNVADWHAAWARWTNLYLAEMPDVRFETQVVNRVGGYAFGQSTSSGTYSLQSWVPPINMHFLTRSEHDNITPGQVNNAADFNRYHIEPSNFGFNLWGLQDVVDWADVNNKQWGLTEWSPQIVDEPGNANLPASPQPAIFIEETYNFLAANQQRLAYDTYYSPGHSQLYSPNRQTHPASIKYKELWTS